MAEQGNVSNKEIVSGTSPQGPPIIRILDL
jgi:hypothetical protein